MSDRYCRGCGYNIAPAEGITEVKLDGSQIHIFHDDCYRQALRRAYVEIIQFHQQNRLETSALPRAFLSIEDGRETVQRIVERIVDGRDTESTAKLLIPLWKIARQRLFYTPRSTDAIEQAVRLALNPPPVPPAPPAPVKRYRATAASEPSPLFQQVMQASFAKNTRLTKASEHLPQIVSDMLAIVGRPLSLVWDPSSPTASTDCRATVRFNPYWFETDQPLVGYGIGYHEAGHLHYSTHLADAMTRAHEEGGESLGHIVNLILDRHDDELNVRAAPGFAAALYGRLPHIFPGHRGRYPFEDFAYACKKRTKPRFKESYRAMKVVRRLIRSGKWDTDSLLQAAKKVQLILRQDLPPGLSPEESGFNQLVVLVTRVENGPDLSGGQQQRLTQVVQGMTANLRRSELKNLQKMMQNRASGSSTPLRLTLSNPIQERDIRVPSIKPRTTPDHGVYQKVLGQIQPHVSRLRAKLCTIDSPVEMVLSNQEEGELDLQNLSRLVSGFSDCFTQSTVEHDIDAEIHLAIDQSRSMMGEGITFARQIGVLFNEGLLAMRPHAQGHLWGYCSTEKFEPVIYDYGPCQRGSAVVNAVTDAYNADYEALRVISERIIRSKRRRRLIIMVGDDGPSNPDKVNKLADKLLAANILVVHIMVGIVAAPRIYPIQLLFQSFPDLVKEFGDLLYKVFQWVL